MGPPRPLQCYLLSIRDSLPCRPHPRPAFDLLVVPASRLPYLYGTAPGTTPTPHWHLEGRGGTPGRASLEVGRARAERAGFSGVSHCPLGTGLAAGGHWEPARGGQMRRVGPGFPEARNFDGWFWWFLIREGRGGRNLWETGRRAEGGSRVGGQMRGGSHAQRYLPEALAQVQGPAAPSCLPSQATVWGLRAGSGGVWCFLGCAG